MTDIEKLQSYFNAVLELNALQGDFDENETYEHIRVEIPPATKIKEHKWNDVNVMTVSREFPFSAIEDVTSRIKKKIAYRKEKLSVKNLTEKNTGEK